ncbi:MAG: type II toxin-antitoxin system VapC family toxin [Caulobacteraceae bacterium]
MLKLLFDTNVVSEPLRKRPDQRVMDWIAAQDGSAVHASVVTFAEIEDGIARLPAGSRRERLRSWRDQLAIGLGRRLIPVDLEIASAWGALSARLARDGNPISPMDGFVAATADVHGLTLVTRNVKHFEAWGGPMLNPWAGER